MAKKEKTASHHFKPGLDSNLFPVDSDGISSLDDDLDVVELLDVAKVRVRIEDFPVLRILVRLLAQHGLKLFLETQISSQLMGFFCFRSYRFKPAQSQK